MPIIYLFVSVKNGILCVRLIQRKYSLLHEKILISSISSHSAHSCSLRLPILPHVVLVPVFHRLCPPCPSPLGVARLVISPQIFVNFLHQTMLFCFSVSFFSLLFWRTYIDLVFKFISCPFIWIFLSRLPLYSLVTIEINYFSFWFGWRWRLVPWHFRNYKIISTYVFSLRLIQRLLDNGFLFLRRGWAILLLIVYMWYWRVIRRVSSLLVLLILLQVGCFWNSDHLAAALSSHFLVDNYIYFIGKCLKNYYLLYL